MKRKGLFRFFFFAAALDEDASSSLSPLFPLFFNPGTTKVSSRAQNQPSPHPTSPTPGHGRPRRRLQGVQDPRRRAQPQGRCRQGPRLGRDGTRRDELAADRRARELARGRRRGPDAEAQGAPDPGGQQPRGADRDRDEDRHLHGGFFFFV